MLLKDYPLRERKFAQTKVDLLKKMLEKTESRKLDDISVKELCEDLMISEGTFFNYFPRKTDLLVYFIHFWTLEIYYLSEKKYGNTSGLKKIEEMFILTASEKTIGNSRIMDDIIAFMATSDYEFDVKLETVTDPEILLMFPQYSPEILNFKDIDFMNLYIQPLALAAELGEIEPDIDFMRANVSIVSIFFGTYLTLRNAIQTNILADMYLSQLNQVWYFLKGREK